MPQFSRALFADIMEAEAAKGYVGNNINFIREPFAHAPAYFGYGNWHWCGAFQYYGLKKAGLDLPIMFGSKFGYSWALVEAIQQWAIQEGIYIPNDGSEKPERGDIGIIDWSRRSFLEKDTDWDDHVTTVLDFKNGIVTTAEGNAGAWPGQSGIFKRNLVIFEGFVRIRNA